MSKKTLGSKEWIYNGKEIGSLEGEIMDLFLYEREEASL